MNPLTPNDLTPRARRLSLPREARLAARQLLAQQCWCWGRDVKRAEGNLLLEYGFERHRPPASDPGASIYTLDTQKAILRLWAFGFFWGEAGINGGRGVYVSRFEFAPLWFEGAAPDIHAPPHVASQAWEALRAPQTLGERRDARRMLGAALREFARYESWVEAGFGTPYRCSCLKVWGAKERFAPPNEVAARWHDLAARIEHFGSGTSPALVRGDMAPGALGRDPPTRPSELVSAPQFSCLKPRISRPISQYEPIF